MSDRSEFDDEFAYFAYGAGDFLIGSMRGRIVWRHHSSRSLPAEAGALYSLSAGMLAILRKTANLERFRINDFSVRAAAEESRLPSAKRFFMPSDDALSGRHVHSPENVEIWPSVACRRSRRPRRLRSHNGRGGKGLIQRLSNPQIRHRPNDGAASAARSRSKPDHDASRRGICGAPDTPADAGEFLETAVAPDGEPDPK